MTAPDPAATSLRDWTHAVFGPGCVPVQRFLTARATGQTDVEQQFFSGLRLRSGVFKTTGSKRLDATIPIVLDHVGSPGPDSVLRVLDVGCSSGVSTVSLHTALSAPGRTVTTVGTDILTTATLVLRADGCGILFDPDEQVIQVDVRDWAVSWFWPPRKVDMVRRPLRVAVALDLLHRQAHRFRPALRGPLPGFTTVSVPLISSAVDRTPGVSVVTEDLLAPTVPGPFHLIRAANLLNLLYFSEDLLRSMLQRTALRLADGGVLFVVRSGPDANRGTLVRREGNALRTVAAMNGGSEVAHLIPTNLTR